MSATQKASRLAHSPKSLARLLDALDSAHAELAVASKERQDAAVAHTKAMERYIDALARRKFASDAVDKFRRRRDAKAHHRRADLVTYNKRK